MLYLETYYAVPVAACPGYQMDVDVIAQEDARRNRRIRGFAVTRLIRTNGELVDAVDYMRIYQAALETAYSGIRESPEYPVFSQSNRQTRFIVQEYVELP